MPALNMTKEFDIDKVICVCAKKDLMTFSVASKYIVNNIKSRDYVVIVPSIDVMSFTTFTDKRFSVIDEAIYTKFFLKKLKANFLVESPSSINWYIQQLLKLCAVSEASDEEVFLIWDADTVPVKKLIFTKNKKLGYYKSNEHHEEYFNFIKLTLNLDKKVDYSFVAQSFVVKGRWFGEFIKAIELGNKSTWINIIIDNINFKKHSAFSEYETLGTFVSNNYQNEIYEIHNEWFRFGNSTFGNINKIDTPFMKFIFARYDFVSFEYWDKKQIKRKVKILFNALIYLLSSKWRQSSPRE